MGRKITLEIEASKFELAAAKACADRYGEKSITAMLRNFVKTELRHQAFEHDKRQAEEARQARLNGKQPRRKGICYAG